MPDDKTPSGAASPSGEKPIGEATPSGGEQGKEKDTYTKVELEAAIKERVKREQEAAKNKNQELMNALQQLRDQQGTSQAEKEELQKRIDALEAQVLSKEELAAKKLKEEETRRVREVEEAKKDAATWKEKHHNSLMSRVLTDAAVANKAFKPEQVVDLLMGKAEVEEVTNEATGAGTGQYVVKVSVQVPKADGSGEATERLPATEAVKRFLDANPNLLAVNIHGGGGAGSHLATTEGSIVIPADRAKDPAAYRAARDQANKAGKPLVVG